MLILRGAVGQDLMARHHAAPGVLLGEQDEVVDVDGHL
jgi:hypothetical protein